MTRTPAARIARRSLACALVSLAVPILAVGCKEDAKPDLHGTPPPPKSSSTLAGASSSSGTSLCAPAGVGIADAKLAAIVPTTVGSWCVLKANVPESWGDGTPKKIEDVSDKIDGGADIYVHSFFARRYDVVRFVDSASKAEIELTLTAYDKPENAYGFFTYKLVSGIDPDPAAAKGGARPAKPFQAGGAAALQTGAALMWKGNYLVELNYTDESKDLAAVTAAADQALPPIAQAIAEKITGAIDVPADVKALPNEAEGRVALGISYVPPKYSAPNGESDALKIKVAGGYAVAFLDEKGKRSRVYAIVRDDVDAAADGFAAFAHLPDAQPLKEAKETADDAEYFPFSVGAGGPGAAGKAEGVAMRKGKLVLAITDEERALGDPSKKDDYPRLSKDEKVAKLRTLMVARLSGSIAPAASGNPAPAPSTTTTIPPSSTVPKAIEDKQ